MEHQSPASGGTGWASLKDSGSNILMPTRRHPFAFQARMTRIEDQNGDVIYDKEVTLLIPGGDGRSSGPRPMQGHWAVGHHLEDLHLRISKDCRQIQVETSYLPEPLLNFCGSTLCFSAPLGHGMRPGPLMTRLFQRLLRGLERRRCSSGGAARHGRLPRRRLQPREEN
jgi:hypothetical protein